KELKLHCDITRDDTLYYYTTCSWMMWNWLVSGLALGCTLVIYDGSPFYPNKLAAWSLIEDYKISVFGTSAKMISASKRFALEPRSTVDLASLRMVLSTGSPLYEEDFDYVYTHVKPDVQLCSISGGTDIVGCFALGNPLLPVKRGYLQSISLGYPVAAYNEDGAPIIGEKGELVCEGPCPSMPIGFWNDDHHQRYIQSYFSRYPKKWHHSDYILIEADGSVKILGRSDATLNRSGVRIGSAEIYRAVSIHPAVNDSVVVHIDAPDHILLFVQLSPNHTFSKALSKEIQQHITTQLSSQHNPNFIFEVNQIPYTSNGKKIELAIKALFNQGPDTPIKGLSEDVLAEYTQIYEQKYKPIKERRRGIVRG
ncbi:MAG: acetoacetate--CoA ligase, partial [Actinobacteria bacterium]|nr:acetoacetate--CoA ligase [Actinomycetota bacterium]